MRTHDMTVMKDEIFGPIVPIMKVGSEEEAVRLANDSHLGLNAYVFTRDREHGQRLATRIQAGSVLINDVVMNGGKVFPGGNEQEFIMKGVSFFKNPAIPGKAPGDDFPGLHLSAWSEFIP